MKKFWFLMVMVICSVGFGQADTFGERFRLCAEIKADLDAADFAAGAAKLHRDGCQADYNMAVVSYLQACGDYADSYYLNPYYYGQMEYYGTLVGINMMRLSMAESALSEAIGELSRYEFEYFQKGC